MALQQFTRHQLVLERLAQAAGIVDDRLRRVPRSDGAACWMQTKEAWIVMPLAPPWTAVYRLAIQDGVPVVAELRILPVQSDASDPVGDGLERGLLEAEVPQGGLTATILKTATIGRHLQDARELITKFAGLNENAEVHSFDMRSGTKRVFPRKDHPAHQQFSKLFGRQREGIAPARGDDTLSLDAVIAKAYADGASTATIAERISRVLTKRVSPAYVTQMIYRARHTRKFLHGTPRQGRAGRLLTDAGHAAFTAAPPRLQRIATEVKTGGMKAPQLPHSNTKNARQSTRGTSGR